MSIADARQSLSLDESTEKLFPLPLTTFESFMVIDARPGYTMMCDLELQFKGSIDRAAFDSALRFAVARNRLFTCIIETRRGGMVWLPTQRMPAVDWAPLGTPLGDKYGAEVDLTLEPGLRVFVRQGDERSIVLLNFHHACSDGIGGFAFIEDFMAGYAAAYPGSQPVEPRPWDPSRLLARGEAGLTGRSLWRRIGDSFAGAREGIRYFLQRPLPIAASNPAAPKEPTPVRPAFIIANCPEEVAGGLRRAASSAKATVNDLLMRDLFIALRSWNTKQGNSPRRRNLRILMPQNLREREDSAMPAANMMSFAFLTRGAAWCDKPAEMLESIREETEAVRRGKLSLYFTGGLASVQSMGLLPKVLGGRMCFATAVLTNLGDPTRRFTTRFPRSPAGLLVGNLVFESVGGVPPLRPETHAAFAIFGGTKTFSISFKWDPALHSYEDAQKLLQEYVAQLQATAASGAVSPTTASRGTL